jgi:ABC-type phosphate transport system substrate-binding protein
VKKGPPSLGICTSAECIELKLGPVERYPGPGQYCPNCGELLQLYDPQKPPRWCAPERPAAAVKHVHTPPRWFKRRTVIGALVLAIGAGSLLLAPHLSASEGSNAASMFGVCGSSVTNRLARDIVGGFVAQNHAYANRIELRDTDCAVRFSTALDTGHQANVAQAGSFRDRARAAAFGSVLGHDGVVAIVNPDNPVSRLTVEQLRQVYIGHVRNWTSLHGRNEPLAVYLPDDATDEARVVSSAILRGGPVGASVIRLPTSADVVRAVVAANGRNRIGMVAFSTAVPAKVLALHPFPAPSILSIGEKQYPLTIGVTINALKIGDQSVSNLLAYATTSDAKAVALRDGFVP